MEIRNPEQVEEIRSALAKLDLGEVAEAPSPIQGSYFNRVELYLSPKQAEGPFVVVSPGEELGEEGLVVGGYRDYEDCVGDPEIAEDLDAAIRLVREYVEELR